MKQIRLTALSVTLPQEGYLCELFICLVSLRILHCKAMYLESLEVLRMDKRRLDFVKRKKALSPGKIEKVTFQKGNL